MRGGCRRFFLQWKRVVDSEPRLGGLVIGDDVVGEVCKKCSLAVRVSNDGEGFRNLPQ